MATLSFRDRLQGVSGEFIFVKSQRGWVIKLQAVQARRVRSSQSFVLLYSQSDLFNLKSFLKFPRTKVDGDEDRG